MTRTSILSFFLPMAVLAFSSMGLVAQAASVRIDFTGVDLVYSSDGVTASIVDAGSSTGGDGIPAESDPLTTVTVEVDNVVTTVLTSDIFADVNMSIPPIPVGGGEVATPSLAGYFDLLTSAVVPGWGLAINVQELEVSYIDLNFIQFVFGGAIGGVFSQDLPGLPSGTSVGDQVTISFAAQVASGSITNNGSFLTGFTASGTGSIQGSLVPEPATASLLVLATVVGLMRRSRSVC